MSISADKSDKIVASIVEFKKNCTSLMTDAHKGYERALKTLMHENARDKRKDKQEWQAQFTIGQISRSLRAAHDNLRSALDASNNWYELKPKNELVSESIELADTFKKMMDYYLELSDFKRYADTFILLALTCQANLAVLWTTELIQNPEYVVYKTEQDAKKYKNRYASKIANKQDANMISPAEFDKKLSESFDDLMSEMAGSGVPEPKAPEQFIEIGKIQFQEIPYTNVYFEAEKNYIDESSRRAYDVYMLYYELVEYAKKGFCSVESVKKIKPSSASNNLIKLTFYTGPLVIDDQIEKHHYYCIIANDEVLLQEGTYPYWEPPGHTSPLITHSARKLPLKPHGEGIGQSALEMNDLLDSNLALLIDKQRLSISGLNIINRTALADQASLDEGLYPGKIFEVTQDPRTVFEHIELSSNIESQLTPTNRLLEQKIDEQTGVGAMSTGGSNPFSRTSAAETKARLGADSNRVNGINLDIQNDFLIPVLSKIFARVLQFGIYELDSNKELAAKFTDREIERLEALKASDRLTILSQYYSFNIKGLVEVQNQNENAMRDNEFLNLINSNGLIGQLVNVPNFLMRYFRNRNVKEEELKSLVNIPDKVQELEAKKRLLLANNQVMPSQNTDVQYELQNLMVLAQSPYSTPALQQYVTILKQIANAQAANTQTVPNA